MILATCCLAYPMVWTAFGLENRIATPVQLDRLTLVPVLCPAGVLGHGGHEAAARTDWAEASAGPRAGLNRILGPTHVQAPGIGTSQASAQPLQHAADRLALAIWARLVHPRPRLWLLRADAGLVVSAGEAPAPRRDAPSTYESEGPATLPRSHSLGDAAALSVSGCNALRRVEGKTRVLLGNMAVPSPQPTLCGQDESNPRSREGRSR